MLQSISWQAYFTAVAAALLMYYTFVWILFFRGKTKDEHQLQVSLQHTETSTLFKESNHKEFQPREVLEPEKYLGGHNESASNMLLTNFFDELHALTNSLGKDARKAELKEALGNLIRKHYALKSIKERIYLPMRNICADNCSIIFDEDEIVEMWPD